MIRIDRGPEPAAFAAVRTKHLSAAIKAYNQHGPGSRELTNSSWATTRRP